MTARARRVAATTLTVAVAIALAGRGLRDPYATAPAATTSTTRTSTGATAARALTVAQINRQDHPSVGLVRRQRIAAARRPMLPALPITAAGVTISIGGLDRDGRTTILQVSRGRRDRRHALRVYREQLRRYGDHGDAYRPRVRP